MKPEPTLVTSHTFVSCYHGIGLCTFVDPAGCHFAVGLPCLQPRSAHGAPEPWETEEDRYEWRDERTGLPCLIVRNPEGALCGYVAVPPGHPWHGVAYSDCMSTPRCAEPWCEHLPQERLRVHGGLTYSGRCEGYICHVPAPGAPDDVWWFGFDCAHAGDLVPRLSEIYPGERWHCEYRDVTYVRAEVALLAEQLAEISHD